MHFIITPSSPEVFAFENGDGAVKITAYGLVGNDYIYFKRVIHEAERPSFVGEGCHVYAPTDSEIALSSVYQIGDCEPNLHAKRNTIFIAERGTFIPVVVGTDSKGELSLQVEAIPIRNFLDTELGISPCGLPCAETSWEWTGNERFNHENIEREYLSNCGNKKWEIDRPIKWWETGVSRCNQYRTEKQEQSENGLFRWKQTEELCGFSPSLPFPIEDCDGSVKIAYIYSPNEARPPLANYAIEDCNGVVGYAYSEPSEGHTVEIKECGGKVIAYASNQSSTAPNVQINRKPEDPIKKYRVKEIVEATLLNHIPQIKADIEYIFTAVNNKSPILNDCQGNRVWGSVATCNDISNLKYELEQKIKEQQSAYIMDCAGNHLDPKTEFMASCADLKYTETGLSNRMNQYDQKLKEFEEDLADALEDALHARSKADNVEVRTAELEAYLQKLIESGFITAEGVVAYPFENNNSNANVPPVAPFTEVERWATDEEAQSGTNGGAVKPSQLFSAVESLKNLIDTFKQKIADLEAAESKKLELVNSKWEMHLIPTNNERTQYAFKVYGTPNTILNITPRTGGAVMLVATDQRGEATLEISNPQINTEYELITPSVRGVLARAFLK